MSKTRWAFLKIKGCGHCQEYCSFAFAPGRTCFDASSAASAGDVVILDFRWALRWVAGQVVGVPDHALRGDFRVLAKEFERINAGGGVVFLVGKLGGLDGGLLLFAEAAVEDGELVVRGQVVGVDCLEPLVGVAGRCVVVLLEIARSLARAERRESADTWRARLEVSDGLLHLAGVALDECAIVEGARVAGQQGERLGEIGLCVVVALPGDFNDGHVGVGVGVVGAQGGHVLEGVDAGLVLLGVEQRDAVVVPAHPLRVLARGWAATGSCRRW